MAEREPRAAGTGHAASRRAGKALDLLERPVHGLENPIGLERLRGAEHGDAVLRGPIPWARPRGL